MFPIDLRSDAVTLPTPAMRAAMARAPVGDDQFGEDPTINRLQDRVAEVLGKEAALWMPTGTMANQVALRVLTRPGDDVIVSRESHAVWHETGASAANAGVQGAGGARRLGAGRATRPRPERRALPPDGRRRDAPGWVLRRAGLHALDHHLDRLAEDHDNAIRAVTHLDVDRAQCETAASILLELIDA